MATEDAPDPSGSGGFDDWYLASRSRLIVAIGGLGASPDVAADAVDEALTRAYERWDRVGAMASPTGWAFIAARNIVRRRARRKGLEQAELRRQLPREEQPEGWELVEFTNAIAHLSRQQREVLVCRHVLVLTEPEIGRVLGVPRGTVSSRLRRAHAALAPSHRSAADPSPTPQGATE